MDIEAIINTYIKKCITQVLQQASEFISKILFEPQEMPSFFKNVYMVFIGIGVTIMACIIAFKLVQYILDVSNDQTQATIWEIITRAVKSSFMIVAAPTLLTVIIGQVVYPLGTYIFSKIATDLATETTNYIISMGGLFTQTNSFVFILMILFITIAMVSFFFKMCIYHADLLLLEILSVWAAISMCADDNNYINVWWREILSQITTILVQTLLLAGVTSILGGRFEWYNFMLLIGFCCLLIKGPSVLRSMWYTTGAGQTAISGGKLATRMLMMKGGV
ncbi:conjugal transfer protein TrbL family protein [Flavobacterium sp. UBA6046]|jgi:hypothetical protein|uniref:conjugal transfer protein TrbL family protein n=1 Tax=Flavobacterium sp. UBA6046 TaxID=1946552 RepID=UPI000E9093F7|nr:conjugal transfer protein TrbL family protein [Flavobacterium sp. UBA6046]HBP66521.1 hypothetical protein [Desulfosporosinus sp.]